MDLGDDLRVDLGCRAIAISAGTTARGCDGGITNRALVDPLLGLAGLDLLAFEFGCPFGAPGAAGLADLLGSTFCFRARFRAAAVLLATLSGRPAALATISTATVTTTTVSPPTIITVVATSPAAAGPTTT